MPVRLTTTLEKLNGEEYLADKTNVSLLQEFYQFMKQNNCSQSHINNTLKTNMAYAKFLESTDKNNNLYNVNTNEQIILFLDTKIKNPDEDPDKKWITTWNDYLCDIKYFFRWFYNYKEKNISSFSEWETPHFAQIKKKKTKRLSPYLETELWDREELVCIIKYEQHVRNKAILALMWDLDARNHEITLLKIKHIRLLEKYGEGEISHEAKTGSGAFLLTFSFPYVRDWLNEHPFSNNPDSQLICNLHNGAPVKPEAIWLMIKRLKQKIQRMLDTGSIQDSQERKKIENLLKIKKWNPYCIRHSAITADSDYLPEYALKKKVRWSMNSRQGNRYIKNRLGNELKQKILEQNGIIMDKSKIQKSTVVECPRCQIVNQIENSYCSKCSYPLKPEAYEEIKSSEENRIKLLEDRYKKDIDNLRIEMNTQFQNLLLAIRENPILKEIKPEILTKRANLN